MPAGLGESGGARGHGWGRAGGCHRQGVAGPRAPFLVPIGAEAAPSRSAPASRVRHIVAVLDEDRCNGCEACVDVCVDQALSMKAGIVVVDERRCTACGVCIAECPNDALSLATAR
jgi:ferredoxin